MASTLANVFFHLLLDPGVYARLRNEIDEAFPSGEPEQSFVDSAKLADLPYLNGVVYVQVFCWLTSFMILILFLGTKVSDYIRLFL